MRIGPSPLPQTKLNINNEEIKGYRVRKGSAATISARPPPKSSRNEVNIQIFCKESSDFQIYRNVAETPLDVCLSGKVCAYLVSRNSQLVVKMSEDICKSTCNLLAEVPAGSRINFEGLAFASKAILRKKTLGCCGQPPSSTPSTE